jgi:hypothetical protein
MTFQLGEDPLQKTWVKLVELGLAVTQIDDVVANRRNHFSLHRTTKGEWQSVHEGTRSAIRS